MMEVPMQKHLLGLRVLRLSKPFLVTPPTAIGEQWDATGRCMQEECVSDISSLTTVDGSGLSSTLSLPQHDQQGVPALIYLGETYRVYVSLHNESQKLATDIVLKVEVITPSQRLLLMQSAPNHKLEPTKRIDQILSHDVKDLGNHNLVCVVSYTEPTGEEKLLKKIVHFTVAKPLEVRPDYQVVENDILLTVQIQNVMPQPVFLDVVSFDAAAGFTATDLNTIQGNGESKSSVFGSDDVFYSRTTRQYLYHISPLMPIQHTAGGTKATSVSVGKLDIVWRKKFGERGRIQTGQLRALIPPPPDLQVSVTESPGTVQLEQPFSLTFTITNTTSRAMRLRLQLDRQPGAGVLWSGLTCKSQTEVGSKESIDLTMDLIPVQLGLQTVGPLVLVDMMAGQKRYQFNRIAQVFVERLLTT